MLKAKYIRVQIWVVACALALFSSCNEAEKKPVATAFLESAPIAEGHDILMKYTTRGKLTAVLKTPKMLDFTQRDFGFWEFPEGVDLDLIDEKGKVSTITADYALSYKQTGLVDMRGNIIIKTPDSMRLKAQQLYWDQNIKWVFTDQDYTSILPDGTINHASGFDANQDFTSLNSRTNKGVLLLQD